MAGRPPKTVPSKNLNRSNEELETREEQTPIYQKQEFKPPKDLTKEERKIWKWLSGIFRETINCRVSDADIHLMTIYCRAKVAFDEADAALKEDGRPFISYECGTDKDGNPKYQLKPNPNIKKRADNAALCIKLFDQLGLSPVARARMGLGAANAKKNDDPFRKLMNRTDS
ncbi:MAG: phage terminase small subunit P27 family [Clostridia bacterium]|nr:phage terminase small subunit P27 family [Clostridia bacterium]